MYKARNEYQDACFIPFLTYQLEIHTLALIFTFELELNAFRTKYRRAIYRTTESVYLLICSTGTKTRTMVRDF